MFLIGLSLFLGAAMLGMGFSQGRGEFIFFGVWLVACAVYWICKEILSRKDRNQEE